MDESFLLITIFLIAGFLEIILAIPLVKEKVKRNWIYGFRTPKTLSSDEIWYKANKHTGKDLIVAGLVLVIGSLFLLILSPYLTVVDITWIGLILIILPLIITIIKGFNYLGKL